MSKRLYRSKVDHLTNKPFKRFKCKECNKEFYTENKEINRGNAKFCSLYCSSINRERIKKEKIQHIG